MPKTIHGFAKGMDTDTADIFRDPQTYRLAENLRLTSDSSGKNFILTSLKGDTVQIDILPSTNHNSLNCSDVSKYNILGATILDNFLYLFTGYDTETWLLIWRVDISQATWSPKVIFARDANITSDVNFDIVAYSTSDNKIKLYWADGVNSLRQMNVTGDATTLLTTTLEDIEIIGNSILSPLTVTESSQSGSYTAGVVQYVYKLINKQGKETVLSPITGMYHITDSSEHATTTYDYKGADVGTECNKAFTLKINLNGADNDYDRINIYSIHYTAQETAPTVSLVIDEPIGSETLLSYVDSGIPISEFSAEELIGINAYSFVPKTIAVKDNRLFAGNIEEEEYDIGDWDTTLERYSFAQVVGTNQYVHKYTKDGSPQLGGYGENITYTFKLMDITLDNMTGTETPQVTTHGDGWSDNWTFPNYASPYMVANYMGYQRDETYRFGIVFKNTKGLKSRPKWIADIKFPAIWESDTVVTFIDKNGVGGSPEDRYDFPLSYEDEYGTLKGLVLYPVFTVSNWPEDAVSCEIVRVKREEKDKTIVMQGMLNPSEFAAGDPDTHYATSSTIVDSDNFNAVTGGTFDYSSLLMSLFTSQTSYKKNIPLSEDYLQVLATLEETRHISTFGEYEIYGKSYKLDSESLTDINIEYNSSQLANYATQESQIFLNGKTYYIATNGAPSGYISVASHIVFGFDNVNNYETGQGNWEATPGKVLANVKRTLLNQYNGSSEAAKANNLYQFVGKIDTEAAPTNIFSGDIFINLFDIAHTVGLIDITHYITNLFIPTENYINIDLSNGNSPRHGWDVDWIEDTDTYKYNEVYSQQPLIEYYVPEPEGYDLQTKFSNRILYTPVKNEGELQDNWIKFSALDYKDLNSTSGDLTKLITYRDILFFFQNNGIGTVVVSPSAVSQSSDGVSLVMNPGGVLHQFNYISTQYGLSDLRHTTFGDNGIYAIDTIRKKILRVTDTIEPLSDMKSVATLTKELLDSSIIALGNDKFTNEVLFTIGSNTLVFNELANVFTGIINRVPTLWITGASENIMIKKPGGISIYTTEDSDDYNYLEGNPQDIYLYIVLNENPMINKTIDNIEILTFFSDPTALSYPFSEVSVKGRRDFREINLLTSGVMKPIQDSLRIQVGKGIATRSRISGRTIDMEFARVADEVTDPEAQVVIEAILSNYRMNVR